MARKKSKSTESEIQASAYQPSNYPRNSVDRSLRIPRAILEQNAGKPCSVEEAAGFLGVKPNGPFRVEVSSGIKFGLLARPTSGQISVTDRAKQILRPQNSQDKLDGIRAAIIHAPVISEVYLHYRGENLPDEPFFQNALTDTFKIPRDKLVEFREIFLDSLTSAELVTELDGKLRVADVSHDASTDRSQFEPHRRAEKTVKVSASDSCFVMMPFAPPHGEYYSQIYKPAIEKAGLRPFRADADIFGTGKIIDQIWSGINSARVLVAELTTRNPNVFYELGLAHALGKPVVLVSSNEQDVPFDLKHIRVIYYDVNDPFWGNKLLDKVAENVLSAIERPDEAILNRLLIN